MFSEHTDIGARMSVLNLGTRQPIRGVEESEEVDAWSSAVTLAPKPDLCL